MVCNNLEGWGVGGRFKRKGPYVYLWLIHIVVWQKPTQHYKAIILQLKVFLFFFFFLMHHGEKRGGGSGAS